MSLIWTGPPPHYRRVFMPSRCKPVKPVYRCPGWLYIATWAFLWAVTTVILRSLL